METQQATNVLPSNLVGEWSNSSEQTRNHEISTCTHHPCILEVVKQSRWLVLAMRVTFNEHNLSIIGMFVEHNRKIFGAVQHSIIGYFLSIIGSALARTETMRCCYHYIHCG